MAVRSPDAPPSARRAATLAPAAPSASRAASANGFPRMFAAIYGFKDVYPDFESLHRASEDADAFVDGEAGFWRFKEAAGRLFCAEDYAQSQHDPLFHFLSSCWVMPEGHQSDEEAAAKRINARAFEQLYAIGDARAGYLPGAIPDGRYTRLHARHCYLLTLLIDRFGTLEKARVAEIGGGFGNMARLVGSSSGFASWTIFDLPFVSNLQEWFLGQTMPQLRVARNLAASEPRADVHCVDTGDLNASLDSLGSIDVLLGTHSWSELPWDSFLWYLNNVLPRTEYLLYATQTSWPSTELVQRKLERLLEVMEPVLLDISEHGNCHNYVMRRRR